jgi:diaminopimelate decarboxylase
VQYTYQMLQSIAKNYGDAFYILDVNRFTSNYRELLSAFRAVYPYTEIAYSYKTNYIPKLCKAVDELGGYAEVVSHMELAVARRIGVPYEKIVFNGPYKKPGAVKELLLGGGCVHLDSLGELGLLRSIAEENPKTRLNVGIRVNFPISDGIVSRFGFDVLGDDFQAALDCIGGLPNVHLQALHCHFASRALVTWAPRAEGMMKLIREFRLRPDRIDLGGGMFGRMDDRLKRQFGGEIPSYQDYADAVGNVFRAWLDDDYRPMLMIEPGSALTGDCMDLAAKVQSVKTVQGHKIATVLASTHNIQMGSKTPPMDVVSQNAYDPHAAEPVHVGGYTCIESDYLIRDYQGTMSAGDFAVFRNVGSYSFVLKPPFILPNFPILAVNETQAVEVVKRAETDADIFQTFFSEGGRQHGRG